jgi:hypothetical protein
MRRSGPDLTNAQKGESRIGDLVRETTAWDVGEVKVKHTQTQLVAFT